MAAEPADRFGLGFRRELAAGILSHLDRIDVVEVLADDFVRAPRRDRRALATLARQVPVTLHGTSLGLASTEAVDTRRLELLARLVDEVAPIAWSEHLAFVRGGGLEIGHLAAPARCPETIEGLIANVERARRVVGSPPLLENVATLLEPPRSTLTEDVWVARCIAESDAPMLLDLHNLHANATNLGFDPHAYLERLPLHRVQQVHLAGGRWLERHGTRRLLDDHLHAVPDPVFALLGAVAALAPVPLTVILERDGDYGSVGDLLDEVDRARDVVAAARAAPSTSPTADRTVDTRSTAPTERLVPHRRRRLLPAWWRTPARRSRAEPSLEGTLAAVFVDEHARSRFLADEPDVDRPGLALAVESYERKRALERRARVARG